MLNTRGVTAPAARRIRGKRLLLRRFGASEASGCSRGATAHGGLSGDTRNFGACGAAGSGCGARGGCGGAWGRRVHQQRAPTARALTGHGGRRQMASTASPILPASSVSTSTCAATRRRKMLAQTKFPPKSMVNVSVCLSACVVHVQLIFLIFS
jgi:hypothetical protein